VNTSTKVVAILLLRSENPAHDTIKTPISDCASRECPDGRLISKIDADSKELGRAFEVVAKLEVWWCTNDDAPWWPIALD